MANYEMLEKSVSVAREGVNKALETVQKALSKKDLVEYNKALQSLTNKVKTLNESVCNAKYAEFLATENPIITAVQEFYIETIRVKEVRNKDDGSLSDVKLEKKNSRIDLEKFCDYAHLDKTWAHDSESLLALLILRETDVYTIKPEELAKKSFYFIDKVRAKKEGETPDSKTQIVSLLQKIIDEAIFVDDGNGKNVYKCTNHDLAFIQDAVTKINTKEKCTIAMLSERQFKTVMMSVFAHCLGEAYKVMVVQRKNA